MAPAFVLARSVALACAGLLVAAVPLMAASAPAAHPDTANTRLACLNATRDRSSRASLMEIPASRRAMLARGVNVTDLFDAGGPGDDLATRFGALRRQGLRHIRIPISAQVFAPEPPPWQPDLLQRLDQAVCAAVAADLGVIIDLHPFKPLQPVGGPPAAIAARLAASWRQLAARYSAAPTGRVFFEMLNEPKFPDERAWEAMQRTILHAIRAAAPNNTVIATASPWSTASALAGMTPLVDRNVAYTFHFYTPMVFSHQAASWSLPSYGSVTGLQFPAAASNVAVVAGRAAAALQPALADYQRNFADDHAMVAEIGQAAAWGRRHRAVVVATEFGAYNQGAPRPSRAAWLADARQAFEHNGIGWTVWEDRGGFGIDDDLRAGCTEAASAATALGLCGP